MTIELNKNNTADNLVIAKGAKKQKTNRIIDDNKIYECKIYNSNFVQHVKNTPMFNFFEYLINLPPNYNEQINTISFAYQIMVPTNDDYDYDYDDSDDDNNMETDVEDNRMGVNKNSLFDLYCCIADEFADFLLVKYGYEILLENNNFNSFFNDINIFLEISNTEFSSIFLDEIKFKSVIPLFWIF